MSGLTLYLLSVPLTALLLAYFGPYACGRYNLTVGDLGYVVLWACVPVFGQIVVLVFVGLAVYERLRSRYNFRDLGSQVLLRKRG